MTEKIREEQIKLHNEQIKIQTEQLSLQIKRDELHNEEMRLKNAQLKNIPLLNRIENARRNVEALGRILGGDKALNGSASEAILKNIKVMNEVTEIK